MLKLLIVAPRKGLLKCGVMIMGEDVILMS